MSLMQLPPELLHRICAYCDTAAIKSTRLACSLLAAVGAEYLLPEAQVFFVRESFDRARTIAQTSGVAKGVRTLCFQADRLRELTSFGAWDDERRHSKAERQALFSVPTRAEAMTLSGTPRGERLLSRRYVKAEEAEAEAYAKGRIYEAYVQYKQLLEDQTRLETTGEAEKTLRVLFQATPRLDSIIFTVANELRVTTTSDVASFERAMIDPWGDPDDRTWCIHQLGATLCAAANANLNLKSLAIATVSYRFFDLTPVMAEQIYRVVAPLEKLRVEIHSCFDREFDELDHDEYNGLLLGVKDGRLIRFFASAANLRKLKVVGPYTDFDAGVSRLQLRDTVGDTEWPHLKTLHLQTFECTQDYLFDLVMRHVHTLQALQLAEMVLTEGNWGDFFKSIAGKLPNLCSAWLRGEFESPSGVNSNYMFSTIDSGHVSLFTEDMQEYLVFGGECPDRDTELEDTDSELDTDSGVDTSSDSDTVSELDPDSETGSEGSEIDLFED